MKCSSCKHRWHHRCHTPSLTAQQVNELNIAANSLKARMRELNRDPTASERAGTAHGWKCSNCANGPVETVDLTLSSDDEKPNIKADEARPDLKIDDEKSGMKLEQPDTKPAPATRAASVKPASVTACGARNVMAISDVKGKGKAVECKVEQSWDTAEESSTNMGALASTSSTLTSSIASTSNEVKPEPLGQLNFDVQSLQLSDTSTLSPSASRPASSSRPIARLPNRMASQLVAPDPRPLIDIVEEAASAARSRTKFSKYKKPVDVVDLDDDDVLVSSLSNSGVKLHVNADKMPVELAEQRRLIAPLPRTRLESIASERVRRTSSVDPPSEVERAASYVPAGRSLMASRSTVTRAARKTTTPRPPTAAPTDSDSVLGRIPSGNAEVRDAPPGPERPAASSSPNRASDVPPLSAAEADLMGLEYPETYQSVILDGFSDEDDDDDDESAPIPPAPPIPPPAWRARQWPPHPLLQGMKEPADWNQVKPTPKTSRKGIARQLVVKPKLERIGVPEGFEIGGVPFQCGFIQVVEDWPRRNSPPETNSPEL
ncbi:hypothetical protein CALVIDRAFT_391554 [Calocera viscosa TUFC12733]|uniref:Uncharacterized protein n=1 Tax=Calocera viscosa (strain TUFC12733) TaxID=1330018 RepID=A0A167GF14_CALVF|nr:hypothetical protein CALVIDRAFT_391554 [Calocera viscosa TUFC12733]